MPGKHVNHGRSTPPKVGLGLDLELTRDPAPQEVAELVLDKARQTVPVSAVRDYSPEGLQVLTNDGVEDGVLGVTRPILRVGMCHTLT